MANSSFHFLRLYNQFYDKIYRYLYYHARQDTELAKDLTSETFLKALENFDSFDGSRHFSAWIYRIAKNCLIDHVRKQKRYQTVSLDDEENPIEIPVAETVSRQTNNTFDHDRLLAAADKLPEQQKEIIMLKYFNDYSNEEIAKLLDLNPSTLRVQQHRALKAMKGFLS